jgi:hypothetical protein
VFHGNSLRASQRFLTTSTNNTDRKEDFLLQRDQPKDQP